MSKFYKYFLIILGVSALFDVFYPATASFKTCGIVKFSYLVLTPPVTDWRFNELQQLNGGCSFAYDVGFFLRILGLSGPYTGLIPGEMAIYNANCN